jgi:hypothetical protein
VKDKTKDPSKNATTTPAPKKARKIAVKDLSEKELKDTSGGCREWIPVKMD